MTPTPPNEEALDAILPCSCDLNYFLMDKTHYEDCPKALMPKLRRLMVNERIEEFSDSPAFFTYGAKKRAVFNEHLADLKAQAAKLTDSGEDAA